MTDWDARTYDRVADPQARWGSDLIGRLPLVGDETVLDAGCGSGRVTQLLLERLPRGRVIALDASPSMLDAASDRLASHAGRVMFVRADLGAPLPIDEPVDAVLSTATFHWVLDHDALFRNLAAVLRPGGRLVAQCGGTGNIAAVLRAAAEAGDPWVGPWRFDAPEATRERLITAGFTDVETWLHPEPTTLTRGEPLERFLATVVLREHLPRYPAAERAAFVRAVAERLPDATIDYVRLDILARRAS